MGRPLSFQLGSIGRRPAHLAYSRRLWNLKKRAAGHVVDVAINGYRFRHHIDTPKGRKGKRTSRTIALPAEALAELAEWRSLLLDQSPEAYLFPSERNTPLSKDNLWRRNMLPKLGK